MAETVSLVLPPSEAAEPEEIRRILARRLGRTIGADRYVIVRRSIDARQRQIRVNLDLRVYGDDETPEPARTVFGYRDVRSAPPVGWAPLMARG